MQIHVSPDRSKLDNFVTENFDFDFCKCRYEIKDGEATLKCKNLGSLLSQTEELSPRYCANLEVGSKVKNRERLTKYINRGFHFELKGEKYL